jgi:hypothetical protein
MSEIRSKVIIPFRDRGLDLRRAANLEVVQGWWHGHGFEPAIVDDGLTGDAQFNRHRAYNFAIRKFPETQVFVFTEADMLIHPMQVRLAIQFAYDKPGLVVPFTQYRYLSDSMTDVMRTAYYDFTTERLTAFWKRNPDDPASIFNVTAESTMDNGRSIGAVNVVSRETLDLTGGYTELTSGNWYDDRIIEEGFRFMTKQQTRCVSGPAVHLYHLPGHSGDHLTDADKFATAHNKKVLDQLRLYIRQGSTRDVKALLSYRKKVKS